MKVYDVVFSDIDTHDFTWREIVHLAHTSKDEWLQMGAKEYRIEAADEFDAAIIARIKSLGKDVTDETHSDAESEIRKHTGSAMIKGGYKDTTNNSTFFNWGPRYGNMIIVFGNN